MPRKVMVVTPWSPWAVAWKPDGLNVVVLQRGGVERGDRDRRFLQAGGALGGGDDDFGNQAGVGGGRFGGVRGGALGLGTVDRSEQGQDRQLDLG
jgi:hypothetical protein